MTVTLVDTGHSLGEIDDDGNRDPFFRRYRYACRCGDVGAWRESIMLARGDHAVHRRTVRGSFMGGVS